MNLNLGCGPIRLPGEIGVDRDPRAAACDVAADLLALPFADASVDQARLSHVLEHFPYRLAPTVLLEVARVLRPGGRIVVGVPDMLGTCRAYVAVHDDPDATRAQRLSSKQIAMRHMFGGQFHDGQEHLAGWDTETLTDLLDACGYRDIVVRLDVERGDVIDSLLAEAVKGGAAPSALARGARLPAAGSASAAGMDRGCTPRPPARSRPRRVGPRRGSAGVVRAASGRSTARGCRS